MQELAFLLTGLAGAASAVAFAKFPKNTHSLKIIGANPRIQREIAYMEVERDTCENCLKTLCKIPK